MRYLFFILSCIICCLFSIGFVSAQPLLTVQQLEQTNFTTHKGGIVSPQALYVDADVFESVFNLGAVVLRKGNSYALMNASGEILVPYNKYKTLSSTGVFNINNELIHNGWFNYSTPDGFGFVDATGKVVIHDPYAAFQLSADKRHLVSLTQKPYNIIAMDGKKYQPGFYPNAIGEGFFFSNEPAGSKAAYRKLNGSILVQDQFNSPGHPFKDKLALVQKRNEFNELKYGFVDATGKLAIPFMYTNMPSYFQNGRARVQPTNTADFVSAIINKQGAVLLKQTKQTVQQMGEFKFFANGLSVSNNATAIMDTSMATISMQQLLQKAGITQPVSLHAVDLTWREEKHPILIYSYVSRAGLNSINPNARNYGYILLRDGIVVPPVFHIDGTKNLLEFDPVSGLARAKMFTGKNPNGQPIVMDGFIDLKGTFTVLLKEKSAW